MLSGLPWPTHLFPRRLSSLCSQNFWQPSSSLNRRAHRLPKLNKLCFTLYTLRPFDVVPTSDFWACFRPTTSRHPWAERKDSPMHYLAENCWLRNRTKLSPCSNDFEIRKGVLASNNIFKHLNTYLEGNCQGAVERIYQTWSQDTGPSTPRHKGWQDGHWLHSFDSCVTFFVLYHPLSLITAFLSRMGETIRILLHFVLDCPLQGETHHETAHYCHFCDSFFFSSFLFRSLISYYSCWHGWTISTIPFNVTHFLLGSSINHNTT